MGRKALELECDAPPYYIVQACCHIGMERPEDVRWLETSHVLARQGWHSPRRASKRWNDLMEGDAGDGLMCSCGAQFPELSRYKFTFNDGGTAFYSFGQCPRCQTVYWHRG
jgi:hypothetical protein